MAPGLRASGLGHKRATVRWKSCLIAGFSRPGRAGTDLPNQATKRPRDRPVTVPGRVLGDQCSPGARMAKTCHQLLQAGAGRRCQRAAHMPQIVEMQTRHASLRARGIPDRPEVRPAQLSALRPTKTRPRSPGSANRSKCQRSSGTSSARAGNGCRIGSGADVPGFVSVPWSSDARGSPVAMPVQCPGGDWPWPNGDDDRGSSCPSLSRLLSLLVACSPGDLRLGAKP